MAEHPLSEHEALCSNTKITRKKERKKEKREREREKRKLD
jgi:hypothetical protein